jgi:undecaprenyl pyrophosphate phosphatase UppP
MKEIFKVFKEIHKEGKNEKYSSKKIWGSIILSLVCITYIGDGFKFYTINSHLFDSMLISGTTLIGLSMVRNFSKNFIKTSENL